MQDTTRAGVHNLVRVRDARHAQALQIQLRAGWISQHLHQTALSGDDLGDDAVRLGEERNPRRLF
ncbi:MAG: hypothetical protein LC797_15150 [Chloroflexi bacterium]|nr:hypothetical protein [Chloroflexota bacterium]